MVDRQTGKAWLDAAKNGQVETLRAMSKKQPALLHYKQPGIGNSALHWAAAKNQVPAIQWLLEVGVDVNMENGSEGTALHTAAANDAWEAVNKLCKEGCDPSKRDDDGQTARDVAALRDNSKIAAFLETRAHLFKPKARKPPVRWVLHTADDGTMRRAQVVGVETDVAEGEEPFYTIRFEDDSSERNTESSKLVPADPPAPAPMAAAAAAAAADASTEAPPFVGAATEGANAIAGPPTMVDGWMSVPGDKLDVVVDKDLGKAWLDAAKGGDLETMQALLPREPCLQYFRGKGISYGFIGHSALHWAGAKNHTAIIEWLVTECRTNPNVRNNGLGSPLHAAAMGGQLEAAKLLCKLGVDTTLLNSQGNQARDEALHYQFPALAQAIDHFTLARKMLVQQAAGESWAVKAMKGLLATAGLTADYTEKSAFITATTEYLATVLPTAPSAGAGADSSVTKEDKTAAAADAESSTDEEEMAGLMAKMLLKQGKTALGLKEEGNTSFVLKTKEGYHRAAAKYTQALSLVANDDNLKVVLHSNHAECMIQLGRNIKAKISAEAALAIDPSHDKSTKRLEKAVAGIQKDKAGY